MTCRPTLIAALATLTVLVASTDDAPAQYNPYFRPGAAKGPQPPVSPYLNLLRGRNTAVNYYLGVQPAQDRQMFLQGQLLGDERRATPPETINEELYPRLAG